MAIETPRSVGRILPSGPETTGQLPQDEFMTPGEFNVLTERYIESVVIDTKINPKSIEWGFKGELGPTEDKLTIGKDGNLIAVPQFTIRIGAYLTPEERGLFFVRQLKIVRDQISLGRKNSMPSTFGEERKKQERIEIGIQDFYRDNKAFVDEYIDIAVQSPVIVNH